MRHALHVGRARLCHILGVAPDGRDTVVAGMLERHSRDSVTYWLQLVLAVGIATFGLIADATGVVIGAMLVSPLMGPIMDLGMGLTTGSAFLVLRAVLRFGVSVIVVVLGAALLQALVPFDVITPEIAARTSPTLLDLFVAVACALAGAFAAIRQGLETASTAAGVAIGIALAPPLCVVGIGLAMGNASVAGGAALLFAANFIAIVSISGLLFLVLGFDEVSIRVLEQRALPSGKSVSRAVEFIWRFFGTRSGIVLRVVLPIAFFAAAAAPLTKALSTVGWQIRTRAEVEAVLQRDTAGLATVQTHLAVERGRVLVRLVVLGASSAATALRETLSAHLSPAVRAVTTLDVVAVPDAAALAAVALRAEAVAEPPMVVTAPARPTLALAGDALSEALTQVWPHAGGELTDWRAAWLAPGRLELTLAHEGPPIGVARELVARELAAALGLAVDVDERAPPAESWAARDDGAAWLPNLVEALGFATRERGFVACVTTPGPVPAAEVRAPDVDAGTGAERAEPDAEPDAVAVDPDVVAVDHDAIGTEPDAIGTEPGPIAPPAPAPDVIAAQAREDVVARLVADLVARAGARASSRVGEIWSVTVTRGACVEP